MVKRRLALVVDVKNWAFDNIARQIKAHLSDQFDIEIVYPVDDFPDFSHLFSYLFSGRFSLVHFFWRGVLMTSLNINFLRNLSIPFDEFIINFSNTIVSTSVYDHLFLEETAIVSYRCLFESAVDGYTVSSQKLEKIYQDAFPAFRPDAIIQDGVDLSLFYPTKDARSQTNRGHKLVVGWAGNSKWGTPEKDSKGLHTIIKPALQSLKKENVSLVSHFADRNVKQLPHTEMNDYYNSLDVYVCASEIEGTPNPVLEAMACGVPIISTDVGIVPEVFGPLQKEMIFERNIDALKSRLKKLSTSFSLRQSFARENLLMIQNFTREKEAVKWLGYINDLYDKESARSTDFKLKKLMRLMQYLYVPLVSPHEHMYRFNLGKKYKVVVGIEKR